MAQHSSGDPIVIQKVRPREAGRLTLTSEAIGLDGRIGEACSGYGENQSPPLVWTGMPEAESFALVVQDPDAPRPEPALHWVAWNIPGTLDGLPGAIRPWARIEECGGMVQGRNYSGRHGYAGPRPPRGDGPHRYHFQLFALDMRPPLSPEAPFEDLVNLLKSHTIAACDLVGTFEQPDLKSLGRTHEDRAFTQAELEAGRGGLDADDVDRHAPHDPDGVVRPDHRR
jgi:Raf kinase inhibitor-like YbhB/YbcL family protein